MNSLSMAVEQSVAVITINHQPANALSGAVLDELSGLFDRCETDDSVRSIIIRGEGNFSRRALILRNLRRLKILSNLLPWRIKASS